MFAFLLPFHVNGAYTAQEIQQQEATFIILFAVNGYVDSSVFTRAFALLPGSL